MNSLSPDAARVALKTVPNSPGQLHLASSYSTMGNNELVELCKQQDQRAFAEIVKRHQRTVYGVLYRLAPDWSDTSDLAQEVFVRMWRCIGQLQNPARFRSWLYRIVMNLFYDELRKRARELPTSSLDEPQYDEDPGDHPGRDAADKSAGPEELCINSELQSVIHAAMKQLPPQFREAIVLREVTGLSYEEIASATNVGIGTVKSRIARARAQVRETIIPFLAA
jgi:RNA polymerase sigma-70 factor, ECF subfamily